MEIATTGASNPLTRPLERKTAGMSLSLISRVSRVPAIRQYAAATPEASVGEEIPPYTMIRIRATAAIPSFASQVERTTSFIIKGSGRPQSYFRHQNRAATISAMLTNSPGMIPALKRSRTLKFTVKP